MSKRYYINFGPQILTLLGPNLYTNIYYVLGEIIANAYDADAENVYIIYDEKDNTIRVEDDGIGMSYEDFNSHFLPIGIPSRTEERGGIFSSVKKRRRMGRKGIGKLAALSVSECVDIISVKNGDKSGCTLSLNNSHETKDGRFEIPAIPENEIHFDHIDESKSGSAIIMRKSRYKLNTKIQSAKHNISLIFPFTSSDFKIHIENKTTNQQICIDNIAADIIRDSDALIVFSDKGSRYDNYLNSLMRYFDNDRYYKEIKNRISLEKDLPQRKNIYKKSGAIRESIELENTKGEKKEYLIEIVGWISTYATTRGRLNEDFPPNHISIIANNKLGQFNILPDITTHRMEEAYVVGYFYCDLLEETELPDIASSNRQGYKEDDIRYKKVLELIKNEALKKILDLRTISTEQKNYIKNLDKQRKEKEKKDEFEKSISEILDDPEIRKIISGNNTFKSKLENAYNLKQIVSNNRKKVLISHRSGDKELVDELEKLLFYVGFTSHEIIYTSSDNIESRIEANADIYEYLKEYFVKTSLASDLCVIYVVNEEFDANWNTVLEAGAGWVLNSRAYFFFTDKISSVKTPFPQTNLLPKFSSEMKLVEAKVLAQAIYQIASSCGKISPSEKEIVDFITKSTNLKII